MKSSLHALFLPALWLASSLFFANCTYHQRVRQDDGTRQMQQVISNDGTIISYMMTGEGPPLLLIHGTTADHSRWLPILPQLEQHFTVYAMDRRGRGKSTDAPAYSIQNEFADVAAVLERIGEPSFVLGHSYGAVCALHASLLSKNINRMVLYEPPIPTGVPMYPSSVPERMQNLIDRGDSEGALGVFFREVVKMPDAEFQSYRTLPSWNTRVQLAPTIPRELVVDRTYRFEPARFTSVQTPTLLLLGGESPLMFREAIYKVDSALLNSRIELLPGEQHIAMDTNPDLFLRIVLQFFLD